MYGKVYDKDYGQVYIGKYRLVWGEPADDWVITELNGKAYLCKYTPKGYRIKYESDNPEFIHDLYQEVVYRDKQRERQKIKNC